MDQPRKVAKPARGQLHKEVKYPCTVRRCIRGKYIHMYLHSTGPLFVFVYIPGTVLLGTCKKKQMPNEWRPIKSLVKEKHGRRGKGTGESSSREN